MTALGQWAHWSCWWLSNYPWWDCICRRYSNRRLRLSSAPNDHFSAGPHCGVKSRRRGRVGSAGGCPTIGAGIVSRRQCSDSCAQSAPNDHFTASPDCRVTVSANRGISGGRSRPRIISARRMTGQQFQEECRQLALTLLPPTSHGARRSAGIQRAEFGLARQIGD